MALMGFTKKVKKSIPFQIIKKTYVNWRNDRTLRLGAGIAYYGVFAIVPLFTLMVGVTTYFYSIDDVKDFINEALVRILGEDLFVAIEQIVENTYSSETHGLFASTSIIGVIALFFTASFIFVAFQDAMDAIWGNEVRLGFWPWIKRYLWAYIVVLVASTLMVSFFIINSIGSLFASIFPEGQLSKIVEIVEGIAVSTATWIVGILILALIYNLLIYKKIPWRIVLFGSAVTSVLIFIGTWALGIYISNYGGSSLGGALGAVLLLLLWVYYQAQIVLIGAQFIKTISQNRSKLPDFIYPKDK